MSRTVLRPPIDGATVYPLRTDDDVAAAIGWLLTSPPFIAVDTETCGIDYHDATRLLQFGDAHTAFVVDPHRFPALLEMLLFVEAPLVMHHASFDAIHLARLVDPGKVAYHADRILERTTDTQVLGHLIDPREKVDGGLGTSLKGLAEAYVDSSAPDGQKALKARFAELGLRGADAWANIPLHDETYQVYAGVDVLLTARLYPILRAKVDELGLGHLAEMEHRVARITTKMTIAGIECDLDYAQALSEDLDHERRAAERQAAMYGVANIGSTQQVAEALKVRGCLLTERTPSGQLKIDRTVLEGLDDDLARAVLSGKSATKARATWVEPIITAAAIDGRLHPRIRALAARTGRSSITNPPLQQLPANDHRVRSCLLAGEGHTWASIDFANIELRCLAVLSSEETMTAAFQANEDLHSTMAQRVFGEVTPETRRRQKGLSFGICYGGGVQTLARQTGISELEARVAMDGFDRSFPRIKRWSSQLIERVKFGEGVVITPTGRRVPVPRDRAYRAVSYTIQGLAADIFKGSLVELDDAGLADYVALPIHDEVLCRLPLGQEHELAAAIAETMAGELGSVPITTDAKIIGQRWGDAYRRDGVPG